MSKSLCTSICTCFEIFFFCRSVYYY